MVIIYCTGFIASIGGAAMESIFKIKTVCFFQHIQLILKEVLSERHILFVPMQYAIHQFSAIHKGWVVDL